MTDVAQGQVRLEKHGAVAHLILDRPSKINAMSAMMDRQMNSLIFDINNDSDIRAVVLYGLGERGFCAGSDITDLGEYGNNWEYRNRFDAGMDYARAVWLIRKPVVAAIHGWCIGGGLEMACAADLRIAAPDAMFGAGEIRHGWHGGSGQTQFLTHQIGPGNAAQFLLVGEPIDAETSLRMGLIQTIVEQDSLLERALALGESIADKAPIAAQMTKHMIRMAQSVPLEVGLLYENDSFAYCMNTDDAAEGRRAFAEKRPPKFEGK